MNPAEWFRGEIPYMDPLARARVAGDLDDARIGRERELSRFDAAERAEASGRSGRRRTGSSARPAATRPPSWPSARGSGMTVRRSGSPSLTRSWIVSIRRGGGQARRSDAQAESRAALMARARRGTIHALGPAQPERRETWPRRRGDRPLEVSARRGLRSIHGPKERQDPSSGNPQASVPAPVG